MENAGIINLEYTKENIPGFNFTYADLDEAIQEGNLEHGGTPEYSDFDAYLKDGIIELTLHDYTAVTDPNYNGDVLGTSDEVKYTHPGNNYTIHIYNDNGKLKVKENSTESYDSILELIGKNI
jgi:hypothetical protein